MGTIFYHPSLLPLSTLSNETSFDSINNDNLLHLFILVSVWIVLIITIIFGTIGNILVLYVYINRRDNKTCTFFIKILAIVDLIICLFLAPLELYQTTTGIRNEFLCKIYGFLNTHVLYSTLLITIIAFDRYFCICWPLYRIITIYRGRAIVIVCGILSFLFAIIPMSEYSTMEHVLHIHNNHSELLPIETYDEYDSPIYTHVEHIKTNVFVLPFTLGNTTNVKCSPRFSLHFQISKFLIIYRIFHSTLFAICIILVLILYSFIYNAVYQRRRTRTKKFSTYRKILHSYLIDNKNEQKSFNKNCFLTFICCYCCKKIYRNRSRPSILHRTLHNSNKNKYFNNEQSCINKQKPEQIILEVKGARGKRYSAISTTSMTYFTSGVWDDTSPTNLVRSRINSIAATTYCGMEHSSTSRPSTSTEDSFDQTNKLKINSTHLTVPKQSNIVSNDINQQTINENELSVGNNSPSMNLPYRSIVRKPSNTLSIRHHQQRLSDMSVHQRKVSFMTTSGLVDQCIVEDPPSTNSIVSPSQNHSLSVHVNNRRSLSITSSVFDQTNSLTRNSITSTRRASAFDGETQRIFERQQRQERLANLRTTLTLFIITATFILMYLPSIIITLFNIKPNEFREVLFLLYYINSACNPLIYSFFNVNFRNDIRRIYECQKREYFSRQC